MSFLQENKFMRGYLTAAIALALLTACSSDQTSTDTASAGVKSPSSPSAAWASPSGARSAATGFASLPDRGELLAYDHVRKIRKKGAYTAYPVVGLSEEHALNAMSTGEMVVNAPNGEQVRLKYDRHVEHDDGNWTWIGHTASGADAILTFGEKAVFGSIPQGTGDTLRLTMSAGQSWLVTTDRSKLAGVTAGIRSNGTDQLVPPKLLGAAANSALPKTAAMRAESATSSVAVVDVLLGYTNGFASGLGGTSQANTRLVYLVDIANQAYANSGVNMRTRLVKTLQVTYPDNTDNGDALEKLTGYKSGDTSIGAADPAFKALRDAREEFGADLVSLVRKFNTPENDGCGIAWLIGGDQSGIAKSDEPFGYSVVSDGTDPDEDDSKTYYCRDETLAHEMGHNMGQAHNEEDSGGTGVHAYSYGYREASSSGFYTVMAYPQSDGSQFSIRYFSNPSVKFENRATGIANEADNVRSLNQTMPTIATFRDTVVTSSQPARNDFNGDGQSDIMWRNTVDGSNVIWRSANRDTGRWTIGTVTNQHFQVVGTGDFNGDGKDDLLWRNSSTGENILWKSANNTSGRQVLGTVDDLNWKVVGVGDFDGDGRSDILWRNSSTGQNLLWKSAERTAGRQELATVSDKNWKVVGIGDFNGDRRSDILWRHAATGQNVIWQSGDRDTGRMSIATVSDKKWIVAGIGDFDADGFSDILWRNTSTGGNVIWKSAIRETGYMALPNVDVKFNVVEVADFNGDGEADILWRHSTSGQNVIWRSADKDAGRVSLPTVSTQYIVGSR